MNTFFDYVIDENTNAKLIIYGVSYAAKYLACRMANKRIAIDYFLYIGDEKIQPTYLLNKQVKTFDDLNQNDNYLIVVSFEDKQEAQEKLKAHEIPNDKIVYEKVDENILNAEHVLVYGGGVRTKYLIDKFGEIKLDSILDSDIDKKGDEVYGISITHPSLVPKNIKDNCAIIISSKYYNAIYRELISNGFNKDQIYYFALNDFVLNTNVDDSFEFNIHPNLTNLNLAIMGTKTILYGEDNSVKEISEILRLFDINNYKVITYDSAMKDNMIYKLAYEMEDNICVVICNKSNLDEYKALKKIGLRDNQIWFIDMESTYYSANYKMLYRYGLDPNLGYTVFDLDGNSEGVTTLVYDDIDVVNNVPVKLLILGGSTTMACGVRNRTWVYYLHECLNKAKIKHIMYCCGMFGYTASQELMKLVRDGILLRPDICICYTGVNNKAVSLGMDKHLFINTYQELLFDSLINKTRIIDNQMSTFVDYGVETNVLPFDFFILQLRLIYAICGEFDIKYMAFLQPDIFSKKNRGENDRMIMSNQHDIYEGMGNELICTRKDDYKSKVINNAITFRKNLRSIRDKYSYMYDLNGLFDEFEDVYLDFCHVNEKGNRIIAEKIYSLIGNDILEVMNKQIKE